MPPEPQLDLEESFAALDRFVAENEELSKLEEHIGRLNIFDALRISRAELRHSNFLAWLLSPTESHGQGDLFLRAILMDVLRAAREQGIQRPVSAVELDGADLRGVRVQREWNDIDLLVTCADPSFAFVFENKVDSGEHGRQLARYQESVKETFPNVPRQLVFLTIRGDEASEPEWVSYTYADIHRTLSRVRRTQAGSLGTDVLVFLDHYLNMLESRFMDNPQIAELCRKIYANHRRAVDLIFEHIPTEGDEIVVCARRWLESRASDWIIRKSGTKYINAVPKCWVGTLCDIDGSMHANAPCDIYVTLELWADADKPNFCARVEVGPSNDTQIRQAILLALTRPEVGFKMQRKKAGNQWTRLDAETLLQWTPEDRPTEDAVVTKLAGYFNSRTEKLRAVPEIVQSTRNMRLD